MAQLDSAATSVRVAFQASSAWASDSVAALAAPAESERTSSGMRRRRMPAGAA